MDRSITEAAKRYADFDRSDPFAYSRAISHYNNGICKPIMTHDGKKETYYNAEEHKEEDKDGNQIVTLRNVVRP